MKLALAAVALAFTALSAPAQTPPGFRIPAMWEYTAPLITPEKRDTEPSVAQKDPTVVYADGKWHVFMTVKLKGRAGIEYCSFEKWEDADKSKRTLLDLSNSTYYCAPQVFYFTPQKKWYLIYQLGAVTPTAKKFMWVAYSTTENIADPASWTKAQPLPGLDGSANDPRQIGGLDYWIISDAKRAYLFYTGGGGKLWRISTDLKDFPGGWGKCEIALEGPFLEAGHVYRVKGTGQYLAIIEENGRRYYKAYLSMSLDGQWAAVAATEQHPFAGAANIRPAPGAKPWTDNVSHRELLRDGVDETMTIDPANLRFLFQGMLESEKAGKGYGQFPWRIGILTPVK